MDAKDVLEVQGGREEGAACCQPQLGNGKGGVMGRGALRRNNLLLPFSFEWIGEINGR